MTLERAREVHRDLRQPTQQEECECEKTSWAAHIFGGDFGFFLGIALVVLAFGYGCESRVDRERASLIEDCGRLVRSEKPTPDVCKAALEGKSQ